MDGSDMPCCRRRAPTPVGATSEFMAACTSWLRRIVEAPYGHLFRTASGERRFRCVRTFMNEALATHLPNIRPETMVLNASRPRSAEARIDRAADRRIAPCGQGP